MVEIPQLQPSYWLGQGRSHGCCVQRQMRGWFRVLETAKVQQLQYSDKVVDVLAVQVVMQFLSREQWKVPQIQFIAGAGGHFRSQQRRALFSVWWR